MKRFEKPKLSSGNKAFDEWLDGGYEKDIISCIYGQFATGKTNFCLMALAELLKQNKKAIYIDTESSFSLERLKQIMGKDYSKEKLKNLIMFRPTSFKEQIEAFDKLLKLDLDKISAIFVDSIGMLYRLELGVIKDEEKEIEKEIERERIRKINLALARQLRLLNEIARKKKIAVIVTNQVYQSIVDSQIHMVGGDILKYWSKCLIQLEHLGDKRKAILIKHRSLPQKEFYYKIVERGIEKIRKFIF
jgi:DNA repair protein RadB